MRSHRKINLYKLKVHLDCGAIENEMKLKHCKQYWHRVISNSHTKYPFYYNRKSFFNGNEFWKLKIINRIEMERLCLVECVWLNTLNKTKSRTFNNFVAFQIRIYDMRYESQAPDIKLKIEIKHFLKRSVFLIRSVSLLIRN